MSVRLPAGVAAAIDGRVGGRGRSKFIREAVEVALGVSDSLVAFKVVAPITIEEVDNAADRVVAAVAPERLKPVAAKAAGVVTKPEKTLGQIMAEKARELQASKPVPVEPADDRWAADKAAVLGALAVKSMTCRGLAGHLGWTDMRVDNVVKRLGSALVFGFGGMLEVSTDD